MAASFVKGVKYCKTKKPSIIIGEFKPGNVQ
jgi:hypothetical protein